MINNHNFTELKFNFINDKYKTLSLYRTKQAVYTDLYVRDNHIVKNFEIKQIPTGIILENLNQNYYLSIKSRNGTSRNDLVVKKEMIDLDYKGEIFISVLNISGNDIQLNDLDRIAQISIFKKFAFPKELYLEIFEFLIFDMYNKNYIDYNQKTYIDNCLLVSKFFNINIIEKMRKILKLHFNIQIINGKSYHYNIWKDLIYSFIIKRVMMDDDLYILERMRRRIEKNGSKVNEIRKNENEMLKVYKGITIIYDFLSRNWLDGQFLIIYNFISSSKSKFRKSLIENYEMTERDIDDGCEYKIRKFKKFYDNYISEYYIYSPKNIKRKFIEKNNNFSKKRKI